ncbi:tetratricopeptide repeat protein [Dactylosporangium sp. NPDC051485]|uniref:tetratricopeptide repeat protein n=1 Tax=Dactylosporangium sp. NPDC051485 TaxID=3154846 RepID=UPI00343E9EB4
MVLERASSTLGATHQTALACASNLAVILARRGERAAARERSAWVAKQLHERLGEAHPFAVAADVNLADDLAAAGEHGRALELGEGAYARARSILGEGHPYAVVAGANLAASRRRVRGRRQRIELDPPMP